MSFARLCRPSSSLVIKPRLFHTSTVALYPRATRSSPGSTRAKLEDIISEEDVTEAEFQGDDTTSAGHVMLRQQRQVLYYLRLIEHELPRLVAYRKPFNPPGPDRPLVVRSISYGGEQHPATAKRTIVVPVSRLPLKDEKAIHAFKLLAGVRWTPEPPSDAGIGADETGREHGYFKLACEDFPKGPMNLKWASDTLDKLIEAANNSGKRFADIPVDTRHIDAKIRKAKKGGHAYGRGSHRPSLKDFPKEWLPVSTPEASSSPSNPQ